MVRQRQGTALAANARQNSKLPFKDEALLGVSFTSVGNSTPLFAAALRTTPPRGVDGVYALTYSGAYPFSRLVLNDSRAPIATTVFAYSHYEPTAAAATSSLPLVYFTVLLTAPSSLSGPVDATFLLSLPLGSSVDTRRPLVGKDARNQTIAVLNGTTDSICLAACDANPDCVWWSFEPGRAATPNVTQLNSDCGGADIYSPPRIAVPTLAACIGQVYLTHFSMSACQIYC